MGGKIKFVPWFVKNSLSSIETKGSNDIFMKERVHESVLLSVQAHFQVCKFSSFVVRPHQQAGLQAMANTETFNVAKNIVCFTEWKIRYGVSE